MELHWVQPEVFREQERVAAEERIERLARGHSDLIDIRIVARTSSHHRHGGQEVRITCDARGRELVAARTRPEAGLALNEAVDAFEREVRRLRDKRAKQRGHRPAEPPELGIVDRVLVEDGYGFILTDSGEQVYFHRNAVQHGLDFERLAEGQRVGLDFEGGEKGLQATVVLPAPPGATGP